MDCFKDFDEKIDAAEIDRKRTMNRESLRIAETDYRTHPKAGARRIAKLAFADVPEDATIGMLPSRLVRFALRVCEVIERGRLDQIDGLLYSFWAEMSSAVLHERQNGILAPVTPETEIKRNRGALAAKRYNTNEVAGLRAVLRDGERLRHVGFRQTQTSERVTSREEIWAAMPHDRIVSPEFIERMRTPEDIIAAAERHDCEDLEAQLRGPGSNAFIQ
jgi:hypothetical protein